MQAELENVLSDLHLMITESGGMVTHGSLPIIYGDTTQIYQLLFNVISNGLKFVDKGAKPMVHVTCTEKTNYWEFIVKDNGIGIKKEYLKDVFYMFSRLNHQDQFSGTGLGLSICEKVVTFHGGRIWLESEVGKGTSVFFTLPKKRRAA